MRGARALGYGGTVRPFRFGVQVRAPRSARAWSETARRIEALGYAVLSMPDHLGDQLAPLPALAAAAAATSRLRLGTWVLANDFRHPVILAKEAATLDLLSDGRLELGIGAGWMSEDYATSGIPHEPPGVRIARLGESLEILRGLWRQGAFSFQGRHYRVTELDGRPKPLQQPHPPLAIGGGGRRILELAAREAQIVGLAAQLASGRLGPEAGRSQTAAATDEKCTWVREALAGRADPVELHARVLHVAVGEDAPARAAQLGAPHGLSRDELLASPHALIGPPTRIEEHLQAARARWGLSYFTVSEDACAPLAPVVARLAAS
jgi:probable F420-dependent oxidoreductase